MTNVQAEATARRVANFGFAAMLFALVGWINLEVLMFVNNPSMKTQLLTCGVGLCLVVLAYRRCPTWWVPNGAIDLRTCVETLLKSKSNWQCFFTRGGRFLSGVRDADRFRHDDDHRSRHFPVHPVVAK